VLFLFIVAPDVNTEEVKMTKAVCVEVNVSGRDLPLSLVFLQRIELRRTIGAKCGVDFTEVRLAFHDVQHRIPDQIPNPDPVLLTIEILPATLPHVSLPFADEVGQALLSRLPRLREFRTKFTVPGQRSPYDSWTHAVEFTY
jgi:hypothetical protein